MKLFKYFLACVVIITAIGSAGAITIDVHDGSIIDWGLDLSGDWSMNDTWIPNPLVASSIRYVVEDNVDPKLKYSNACPPVDDIYAIGVHIRGTYPGTYSPFSEKVIRHNGKVYCPPAPTWNWVNPRVYPEKFDIEAIYWTEDDSYIYVLIITSLPQNFDYLGDLAIDVDGDSTTGGYGYDFGIELGTIEGDQFGIYATPDDDDWTTPTDFPSEVPANIKDFSNKVGQAEGQYFDLGISDNGYPNYAIELAIPKTIVQNAIKLHVGEKCGNDTTEIPEFPLLLIPAGIILGFFYYHRRKNN
jgi:hypothetical protein